jgi:hypothetical protein
MTNLQIAMFIMKFYDTVFEISTLMLHGILISPCMSHRLGGNEIFLTDPNHRVLRVQQIN